MCRSAETVSLIKSCRRACYRYHLISILKGIFDITETRIVLEISDGLLPQPIILGNIYRPPRNNNDNSNIRNFTYELSTVLNEFTKLNYSIIITGDFHINLFEINERECYGEFLDMIISTERYPKISLPTKCRTKVSLIDQKLCRFKYYCKHITPGIILAATPDHYAYFSIWSLLGTQAKSKICQIQRLKRCCSLIRSECGW